MQKTAPEDQTRVHVLIPAAGRGERFGTNENKLFAELAGKPVIAHTAAKFLDHAPDLTIDSVTIIACETDMARLQDIFRDTRVFLCLGGKTRQESVERGLRSLSASPNDIVLVHDGARPLVSLQSIRACINSVVKHRSAIVAMPVVETLKRSAPQSTGLHAISVKTLDRQDVWSAQTPQGATYSLLVRAFSAAESDGFAGTDEASLLERLHGIEPALVLGSRENIKITTIEDLQFAQHWLNSEYMIKPNIRVGTGYDIHRLVPDRSLILGGVKIESDLGLLGHSDADVVLHAIADSLLGAGGLPDIGHLFPNDDPAYAGADSIGLLQTVVEHIGKAGYEVGNVDCCVIAERPKIAPYIPQMRTRIADALGVDETMIGIKATTNEGLGALGKGEGIACHATSILFGKK